MRAPLIIAAVILAACTPTPPPSAAEKPKPDPVTEEWYAQTVKQLTALNEDVERSFRAGKLDAAGESVTKGQPLAARLLEASRPSLAAMEAASDLDDAYGRLLLSKHNTGWARMVFQKNLVRWTSWKPQTDDTQKRRKQAADRIAECDRSIAAEAR